MGVAIGAGTDVAMEAADFVLMRSDVRDILTAFDISRATFTRIKLNFMWAYGYNVVAIPFAAGVCVGVNGWMHTGCGMYQTHSMLKELNCAVSLIEVGQIASIALSRMLVLHLSSL